MLRRWFALVLVCSACDEGPDEARVDELAAAAVEAGTTELKAEAKTLRDANAALEAKVTALEDKAKGQTSALDTALANLESLERRISELETKAAPPVVVAAPAAKVYKVELGDARTRGLDDALVTLVQYSDYECPHCSRMGPVLDALKTKYGDELRFAFKHFPLQYHTHAKPAAIAAEAAGEQGKFWEMHAKILANSSDIDDANLRKWAKEIGLNMSRFDKDIADPAIEARVDGMKADGEALGVVGTPDFYINGRHVEGGNTADRFEEIIDEELPRARALVASGVAATDVYERTIASGHAKVDSGY